MKEILSTKFNKPLVSICCITYNHENYIRECLDGFVMQQTNFPYEIIIHDDASTDSTAAIIHEYKEQHPNIIKPIYQNENMFSKGKKITAEFVLPKARGKYIALCEGDDYWTDPLKLQKQVDFLENNPEYVVCYHDVVSLEADGSFNNQYLLDHRKCDYTSDEMIKGAWIPTMTRCFRNVINGFPEEYNKVLGGDLFLTVLLGFKGKAKYLNDIKPTVYRKHSGGIWSSKNDHQKQVTLIENDIYIYQYISRQGLGTMKEYYLCEKVFLGIDKAFKNNFLRTNIQEKDKQLRYKEKQLKEKDEQLKEKDEQLKEKDEQLKEKDEQLKEKDEQLKDVFSSYAYRIGRMITWLPRNIIIIMRKMYRA